MIYGLAKSASSGGFGATEVWAPGLIGAALIVGFVFHALRTPHALIDLNLFKNRTFAVSAGTLILMIISVFGAMLLLPLYLQAVRGESAFNSGLLLAPQGLGAMIAMPIAGQLTDKTGVGKIVIPGLLVLLASTVGLTQLTGDTSYWTLSAVLFVMGIGMGFSMMPLMSGAMQTLRRIQVARASTTLNIIQQVGASIGTAVMSVILTVALTDRFPDSGGGAGGGLGGTGQDLPLQVRNLMTEAFTHTYWWAVALIVPAVLVAFLLPRKKAEPIEDDEPGADEAAPVLMHA
jgi:MFS family permease